jgi:hypothetical protein
VSITALLLDGEGRLSPIHLSADRAVRDQELADALGTVEVFLLLLQSEMQAAISREVSSAPPTSPFLSRMLGVLTGSAVEWTASPPAVFLSQKGRGSLSEGQVERVRSAWHIAGGRLTAV